MSPCRAGRKSCGGAVENAAVRIVAAGDPDRVVFWTPDGSQHQDYEQQYRGVTDEYGAEERLGRQAPVGRAQIVGHPGGPEQSIEHHPREHRVPLRGNQRRGRRGATIAIQAIAAQASKNSVMLTKLSMWGVWPGCRTPSKPGQPVKVDTTVYNVSGSAPRRLLRRKNPAHPAGNRIATGRLISAQAAAAAAVACSPARNCPARRHNSRMGTRKNS